VSFNIYKVEDKDEAWELEIVRKWGADFIVSRGRKIYPTEIEGFYALDDSGHRVGLVTFEIINDQCEIVTLDAFKKFCGIGTALLESAVEKARGLGVKRVWLITINDNLDAIRFYQRRGFRLAAIHKDALNLSRQIKPSIPEIGMHGIPLRDEIEFEMILSE
jgi:N-acetylglutamate synthase-like GNAT family acetyltransferase